MTDNGVPQICPIGDGLNGWHNENMRWYAPEDLSYATTSIPEASGVWSFGMTIYVRFMTIF